MSATPRTRERLAAAAMPRASFLRLGLFAVSGAWLHPRLALADTGPEELSGRYRHRGGASELEALEQAVAEATSEMNVLIRGIARSRISSAVEPRSCLDFDFGPNRVTFRSSGMPVLDAPLDRATQWTNPEGAAIAVRCRLDDHTLRMRYVGDGGDTLCTYHFDPKHARMVLRARIDHARLPATLRYTLTYRHESH
jgi:hypothetical protein